MVSYHIFAIIFNKIHLSSLSLTSLYWWGGTEEKKETREKPELQAEESSIRMRRVVEDNVSPNPANVC